MKPQTMSKICYCSLTSACQFRDVYQCNIALRIHVHRAYTVTCWALPSNQSFYRQIAGYQRGVGNRRVGQ